MGTYNWGQDETVVAGADLSAQQYKNVDVGGTLAGSCMAFYGILQNKPQSGEHSTVRWLGFAKAYMPVSMGVGAYVGQSDANSGQLSIVTSGFAVGVVKFRADSGGIATVRLWGGPKHVEVG